jgi:Tol biopolymer transport system component
MRAKVLRVRRALLAVAIMGMLGAASAEASFPGRNGEIVYSWDDWSGKVISSASGVDAYDARRKRERRIAVCMWNQGATPSNCGIGDSATSPDGRSVAMMVAEPSEAGAFEPLAYRLSIVGAQSETFPLPGPAFDPAWSPKGDSLLLTLYDGPGARYERGPVRVAHYALDGRELPAVVGAGASDADWSSKGDIAFVQDEQLWVTRAGGSARQVTAAGGTAPSWSPDGRQLAFARDGGIWTALADGSGQRRLTRASGTSPAWSPDGAYIAFVRPTERGSSKIGDIWSMRSDGCRPHALLSIYGLGGYGSPSWRRLPGKLARPTASVCSRQKVKRRTGSHSFASSG